MTWKIPQVYLTEAYPRNGLERGQDDFADLERELCLISCRALTRWSVKRPPMQAALRTHGPRLESNGIIGGDNHFQVRLHLFELVQSDVGLWTCLLVKKETWLETGCPSPPDRILICKFQVMDCRKDGTGTPSRLKQPTRPGGCGVGCARATSLILW
jgi:hypothetical protein